MTSKKFNVSRLIGISFLAAATACPALAQTASVLHRGDAVVTGFSGSQEGASPDGLFIDLDGSALQIMPLQPNAPPTAQLINGAPGLQIRAADTGQVFALAIDDGLKPSVVGVTPNIYAGATSAYGLRIVVPQEGQPKRVRKGHPDAEWMAGQFGKNGGPGSIWKVDGTTGAVSLFATLPGNSGPGVGDIAYDTSSLNFYVSDLDTGLIHRIDSSGNLLDAFDHGVKARDAAGLPPVADDGATMDIRNPGFDSEDPATWRFTQPERRVWGLAVNGGRLYYAVAEGPSIWSVSIKLDGSFGNDARREFEIPGTPDNHPVSDIAFDGQGMMYVAQRGDIRGNHDDKSFTEPKSSVVFRYRREIDDKSTPGVWVPVPEEFAVGFSPDHRNTSGGIALGYGYDAAGQMRTGQCGATLWSTGDNLREGVEGAGTGAVHGLQGSDRLLVRPDNEPPTKSFFVDYYAGRPIDAGTSGHVGDVEIWQPCDQASYGYGPLYAPLPYLPPGFVPPLYDPPGVGTDWDFNLAVDKAATPFVCAPGGAGFLCSYTVRVTNTGPDPYIGPVTLHDKLIAAPAGATMAFNDPPWACLSGSPTDYTCTYPMAVLWPGSSVDLKVSVDTPAPAPVCSLDNTAHLQWSGPGDANPGDDFAWATAGIPAGHCPPVAGEKTNLKLSKIAWKPICTDKVGHFECEYAVQVRNDGGAVYNGDIKIDEAIPAGTTPTFFIGGTGSCTNVAPYSCTFANDVLAPGAARVFGVSLKVPKNMADDLACQATNKAKIVEAAGNTDLNTDATDDEAEATATIPGTLQQCPDQKLSNLKIKKTEATGAYCPPVGGNWECKFNITVQNFGKPMNNQVRFIDALPAGAPAGTTATFATPAGWSCNLAFFPLYVCQSANPGFSHLEKAEIVATVKVPIHPTQQCSIKNTAQITTPLAPSAQNTFGGDDKSDATAHFETIVPQNGNPFCVHPPGPPPTSPAQSSTNLTIAKTAGASTKTAAGQTTPFTITVTNAGPGVYNGPIVVRETLPGEPENATWSAPWTCEGQTMAGLPNDALCSHPPVELQAGDSVTLNLDVEMPNSLIAPSGSKVICGYTNTVAIEEAAGGSQQNTNAGDDTATAGVTFAPFEKHGTQYCGADDLTTPPPPPPSTCPQGWSKTPVAGKCCPPRTFWNGKRCSKDDTPDTCKPKTCKRDQVWDVGVCRCVDLQCPTGTRGDYPNCKPVIVPPVGDPPPTCKPKTCERNEVWDVGVCRCIERQCPNGTVGDYPNCKPKECPAGFTGIPPNCTPRIVTPPGDTCKPKSCGHSKVWNPDSCSCITKACPDGTIGKYPKCKPKQCPDGMVGNYPNCRKPPETCKPGFTGTPPNCKRIVIVDPPRKCPDGFVGKPPKCKRLPPPKCPSGFRGNVPNCKPINPPRPPVKPLKIKPQTIKAVPFRAPRAGPQRAQPGVRQR